MARLDTTRQESKEWQHSEAVPAEETRLSRLGDDGGKEEETRSTYREAKLGSPICGVVIEVAPAGAQRV